tara:strand:- start:247 stop:2544 length:2298 start_codon:yes stop_codon:yes gene_type:complete
MENFDLIVRTLDLSRSGTREETLEGIVNYVIYKNDSNLIEKNLGDIIEKYLGLRIHDHEILEALNKLLDDDKIGKDKGGNLSLKPEAHLELKRRFFKVEEEKRERFDFFKENILKIAYESEFALIEEEILELWETFTLYIYDCYLIHGRTIIHTLTSENSFEEEDVKKIYNRHSQNIKNDKLEAILQIYVQNYPQLLDSNSLNYLTGLANKTESFYSLGLQKKEYLKLYEDLKFDWIVFVDTNFLYSILNLHNHPEDNAAKSVMELGTKMGIKFKYIPETYEELMNRRKDFDRYILKELKPSQIKALISSDKLDNFASTYYQKKLDDPENTPHPNDILLHSQNNLKAKKIDIYRSKFEALKKNEDYILDQESEYGKYLDLLDEARIAYKQIPKGRKDPVQIQHDILLREVILHLRNGKAISLSDAKYFGVTLDKTLIKFDYHQLKKKAEGVIIPSFFKPSFLLKKLLRHSPLQADDYLRAFIATISTPALDENSSSSKLAIRSLKYFYNMGIDNESLILSCLKDELFLKEFEERESSGEELYDFVESEINKQVSKTTEELGQLKKSFQEKEKKLETVSLHSNVIDDENRKLEKRIEAVSNNLMLYQQEIKKLVLRPKAQPLKKQLTLEDEMEFAEKERTGKELEEEKEKTARFVKHFKSERENEVTKKVDNRRLIGYGFLVVGILIIVQFILVFIFIEADWNYVSTFLDWLDAQSESRKNIAIVVVGLVIALCQWFLGKGFYNRVLDKKAENEFREEELKKIIFP